MVQGSNSKKHTGNVQLTVSSCPNEINVPKYHATLRHMCSRVRHFVHLLVWLETVLIQLSEVLKKTGIERFLHPIFQNKKIEN